MDIEFTGYEHFTDSALAEAMKDYATDLTQYTGRTDALAAEEMTDILSILFWLNTECRNRVDAARAQFAEDNPSGVVPF